MIIDLNGRLLKKIALKRDALQGSVFGAIAYIVAYHGLHLIFQAPKNNHLYVDDLESVFVPSLYKKFSNQLTEVENRINNDLDKLHKYVTE
jgi:hypothetical protein